MKTLILTLTLSLALYGFDTIDTGAYENYAPTDKPPEATKIITMI